MRGGPLTVVGRPRLKGVLWTWGGLVRGWRLFGAPRDRRFCTTSAMGGAYHTFPCPLTW
jgi:hypothetical protein